MDLNHRDDENIETGNARRPLGTLLDAPRAVVVNFGVLRRRRVKPPRAARHD